MTGKLVRSVCEKCVLGVSILEIILLVPLIHLQMVGYYYINSQILAMLNLGLVIVLTINYRLWVYRQVWFLGIFMIWMWGSALLCGTDILKAFGCTNLREWYLAILAFFVTLTLKREKKHMWLLGLMSVGLLSSVSFFILFMKNATNDLLYYDVTSNMSWGIIKSGRLHAFSNANSVGVEATAATLMAAWLFISLVKHYREMRSNHSSTIRKSIFVMAIVLNVVSIVICITMLSLAGSRGSIVSTALGLGVMAYGLVYNHKYKVKGWSGRTIASVVAFVVAVILSVVVSYAPKKAYDLAIERYVNSSDSERLRNKDEILERLKPLGVTYEASSFTDRTLIWRAVIDNLNEQPSLWLTGVTAPKAAYTYVQDVYEGRPDKPAVHAHNGYMEALLLYGIPGVLILGVMLIDWIIVGIKAFFKGCKEGNLSVLIAALAVAAMAEGMVEVFPFPYTRAYSLTFLFFVAVGTCIGINEGENNEQTKEQII